MKSVYGVGGDSLQPIAQRVSVEVWRAKIDNVDDDDEVVLWCVPTC